MARLYKRPLTRLLALCFALTTLFGCTQRSNDPPVETTNTAKVDVTPSIPSKRPSNPQTGAPDTDTTPTPTPTPTPKGPDLTAQTAVDNTFFEDAAFLGNSLIDGFRLFSGLDTCDYYCATSMTVTNTGNLIADMAQQQYKKVYILLGINEIGYDVDYFSGLYQDMLDDIIEKQPDADIYIMSLTPVSAHKSSTSDTFNMDRIATYNDALHELAEENDCYYVDLCEALSGSDGFLPSDVTSDGVHFAAGHYKVWLEYLKTHYNPENA